MEFGRYTAQGARWAVELINAHQRTGLREPPAGVAVTAWDPADASRLRRLCERLREAFAADDDRDAADAVNGILQELPLVPRLSSHDGRPAHLHYAPPDADVVTRLACNVAMAVAAIISEHGVHRLGLCAAPSCGTAFVDTSRNGRRRFCSPSCANRTHVAAHRQRLAGTAS